MSRLWLWIFPSLFAVYPAVAIAAPNPAEVSLAELAAICGALFLGGAVVRLLVWALLRGRAPAAVQAVIAAGVNVWLFCSTLVWDEVAFLPLRLAGRVGLPLAVAGGAWLLVRRRPDVRGAVRFLSVVALALPAFPAVQLLMEKYRHHAALERSAVARAAEAPARPAASGSHGSRARPDVYLVVLDQYAATWVLRDGMGFSNHRFEGELQRLGFVTPPRTRSNYGLTMQSLPSLLNMEHLPVLAREVDPEEHSAFFLAHLIRYARVGRLFKELGYRVYFQPGPRAFGTRENAFADSVFLPRGVGRLRATVARSALASFVWASIVPGRLARRFGLSGSPVPRAGVEGLRSLRDIAGAPGPKFVFLHSMLTHPPFGLDAGCGDARFADPRRAYVEQLQCANRELLGALAEVLRRSESPPVILLLGDHGPRMLELPPDVRRMTREQAADRFGAFAAYHLPHGGDTALPGTITPVNVFRFVFDYYYGMELPLRADVTYHSSGDRLYRVQEVPDSLFPRPAAGRVRSVR